MATIDDLPQKSISEMTDSELMELIRMQRKARTRPAAKTEAAKKKTAAKDAKRPLELKSAKDIVAGLTPEQRAQLLEDLKNG